MRIIIDTNVLVSAAIADGNPEIVIDFIANDDSWNWGDRFPPIFS